MRKKKRFNANRHRGPRLLDAATLDVVDWSRLGVWCSGPTRCPVKAETAGSNPVIPAEPPGQPRRLMFSPGALGMHSLRTSVA